uniref:Uncharacterized protein n=1 Tax=Arundo donax TaxID=35708 RepID=A0A0A9SJJ3_ARUDO
MNRLQYFTTWRPAIQNCLISNTVNSDLFVWDFKLLNLTCNGTSCNNPVPVPCRLSVSITLCMFIAYGCKWPARWSQLN